MPEQLSKVEWEMIIRCLNESKRKIEDYPLGPNGHQSYEEKQRSKKPIDDLIDKVRDIKNASQ